MLPIFLGIVAGVVIAFLIEETASWSVYGKLLTNEEVLDTFFEKHWETYKANGAHTRLIYGLGSLPYLSRAQGILWKWSIEDIGRIPRWSKWPKKLDALHAEMLPIKKLSDY